MSDQADIESIDDQHKFIGSGELRAWLIRSRARATRAYGEGELSADIQASLARDSPSGEGEATG